MSYTQFLSENSVAIFLFHGVVENNPCRVRNYTRKHLLLDEFVEVIGDLAQSGTGVSMDEVIAFHESGAQPPPRAFAITFDDGFENNLTVAVPVLADFRLSATFYITTDFVERNLMSWTDRIEWAFEEAGTVRIALPWDDDYRTARSDAEKRALLDDIRAHVKTDLSIDAQQLASDLQDQIGFPETWSGEGPLDRKLNWPQVRDLGTLGDNIIGGHSHTHAILSALDEVELNREIGTSLNLLRTRAGVSSSHYSYPEGLAHCVNETVIAALKANGIRCSPTAISGVNPPSQNLFELRRITVV